jgi:hypothetical protein
MRGAFSGLVRGSVAPSLLPVRASDLVGALKSPNLSVLVAVRVSRIPEMVSFAMLFGFSEAERITATVALAGQGRAGRQQEHRDSGSRQRDLVHAHLNVPPSSAIT